MSQSTLPGLNTPDTTTEQTQTTTTPDDPLGDIPRENDCRVCDGAGYYEDPATDETIACFACVDIDGLNEDDR